MDAMRLLLRCSPLVVALALSACSSAPADETPTAGASRSTRTPPPTATPARTPTAEAGEDIGGRPPPLPTDRNAFFLASGACAVCHENLLDDGGADVSLGTAW